MGPLMIMAYVCGMILYMAFFSGVVYVFVVADPDASCVAGLFRRRLPRAAAALSSAVQSRVDRLSNTIFREGNPILKVATFSLVVGCWAAVFAYAYPHVVPNNGRGVGVPSSFHRPVGVVVFALCMASWAAACSSDAGTITARTLHRHDNYPYDDVLYSERTCPTVGIRKLARSKYDVASGRHVPRFDHYCPWINNPVGEENYRLFLAFLAVHVGMCWYGSVVTRWILESLAEERGEGGRIPLLGLTLSGRHWQLSTVHLIMTTVAIMLTIFGSFHVYLVSNNLTTNEYYKWKQLKAYHSRLKKKYEAALREGNAGPPRGVSCFVYDPARMKAKAKRSAGSPAVAGATNPPDEESAGGLHHDGLECSPLSSPSVERLALESSLDGGNVTCAGPGSVPASAAIDGKSSPVAERGGPGGTSSVGKKGDGGLLVSDPGPLPMHKYDIGLFENVREVLFPRSLRPEGPQREWKAKARTGISWESGSSSGSGKAKAV